MSNITCPLCTIPQHETLLYEDDKVYLVSTKDQKGHKVRVMSVSKRHTVEPTFEEQITAIGVLINYMQRVMKERDWYIVSNKYASIPLHFHIIAVDEPIEDEQDKLFFLTPKVVFPIKGVK
jgi:diadenosine tetraphosphate (Ap4A) HIT family hydrolase